jgi:hypothetical protein
MAKTKKSDRAPAGSAAGEIERWCNEYAEKHGTNVSVAMTALGATLSVSANTVRSWLAGGKPGIRTAVKVRDEIGIPVEAW